MSRKSRPTTPPPGPTAPASAPPAYTVEAMGYAVRVEGPGAADFARRLHEHVDRAVDGELLTVPPGVTVRCVRAPEVASATLRIEGRG
jgi:hypothetical protein